MNGTVSKMAFETASIVVKKASKDAGAKGLGYCRFTQRKTTRKGKIRNECKRRKDIKVMSNLLCSNKSRMKGDFQVRFCERLAGVTPACLLDRNWGVKL